MELRWADAHPRSSRGSTCRQNPVFPAPRLEPSVRSAPGANRKSPAPKGDRPFFERRRADSNRRMEVLQTSALPLGYGAKTKGGDGRFFTDSPPQSGKPDSNRRPQPWQGCALPTELFPQGLGGPGERTRRAPESVPSCLPERTMKLEMRNERVNPILTLDRFP